MATVPLSNVVDSLLQKSYHDLTVLQELLMRKSDGDRKSEIVKYAKNTRSLLIRLLALVKWAGNSGSVQKCAEMSTMLNQQSGLYVDTADRLVDLARSTLVNACLPNFSLAPAIDVLTTGNYLRLPTCIKDRVVPLSPLTETEEKDAAELLNFAIRHRLPAENIPDSMLVTCIGNGVIKFKVPYEFEIALSVVSGDPSTPWRLVGLKILVGDVLPQKTVLLHEHQRLFLHQVIQSRLYSEDTPLEECHRALHSFCLSLQLDCLNSQAQQLCSDVYGGYMKVDEYLPGHHLKIVYWRPGSSQFMSAFLLDQSRTSSWPKVLISIDPTRPHKFSFTTQHFPPLPEGSEVMLSPSKISLETLLKECVRVRSHTLLKELLAILRGTSWEAKMKLVESPLTLRVEAPLKYGSRTVLLCVDPRVGNIVASVDPPISTEGVKACLEELEKNVTSNWNTLPMQLSKLQCHMFVGVVSEVASEQGIPVRWSLPLVSPLPFPLHTIKSVVGVVYLELRLHVFLVVHVGEGLSDSYHLLSLAAAPLAPSPIHSLSLPHTPEAPSPPQYPKIFYTASSLVTLNIDHLFLKHLQTVVVRDRGPALKRKLVDSGMDLPSLKRLCQCRTPDFAPLPSLISSRMALAHMEASLTAAGIAYSIQQSSHGCPSINIFSFPISDETYRSSHKVLSSNLQSCSVIHTPSGYTCSMTLKSLGNGHQQQNRTEESRPPEKKYWVLRSPIASGSGDLGQTLLGVWRSRCNLLALTLELRCYLQSTQWPLHTSCSISEFSYEHLVVSFNKHTLTIKTTPIGLSLSLSPDCPHNLVRGSLESFLHSMRSVPLLLQGMCASEETLGLLRHFSERISAVSVSAATPSQLQIIYDNLVLSLSIQAFSEVTITGIRLSKPPTTSQHIIYPFSYLQMFLSVVLSDSGVESDETSEDLSSQPLSTPQKNPIYTTPSPISFPRRISYPDSVPSPHGLPSILPFPSSPFPSPAVGACPGGGVTNITLSLDQLRHLLEVNPPRPVRQDFCIPGCSLLESFLGSLSLLCHITSKPYQLAFVQCDRGVYSYRSENLIISFAMEGGVLKAALKPTRENVWSNGEVELLADLFKREVVTPNFGISSLSAFLTLLILPISVFKSVVQLLQHQQKPPSGMTWSFSLCLAIPQGADLTGIPFSVGGPAVIYGRNKLLLFMKLERNQDKKSFILQIMYDPKPNMTYVARFQNQHRSVLHQQIDNILRKASGDFASTHVPGHISCSLYAAVLSLAQATLSNF